jgi:RNA polymerase sigma factor (sigma-70 family)
MPESIKAAGGHGLLPRAKVLRAKTSSIPSPVSDSIESDSANLAELRHNHDGALSDSTIKAICDGDNVAWASLHTQLAGQLQQRAVQKIGCDLRVGTSPSDIVQDTFLLAHRSASSFRGKSLMEVFAWINCIFSNRIKRAYRDEKNTLKRSFRREAKWHEQRRALALEEEEFTPSRVAQENEERELLDQAFRALSKEDQTLISDHFIKGMSFSEIARKDGRTEVATRKQWSRALARWRRRTLLLSGESTLHSA